MTRTEYLLRRFLRQRRIHRGEMNERGLALYRKLIRSAVRDVRAERGKDALRAR